MTTTPQEPLSDDDMLTTASGAGPVPTGDADGTDGSSGDADGTDGASGDADGTDGASGDADGTDGGDADGTDA